MTLAKLAGAVALACVLCAASTSALASGAGGGGMSSSGMSSTPSHSAGDPAAAYQAGVAALQAHNYTEAVHQFRIAQHAAPNNGVVNYALGLSLLGADDKPAARDALRRAVHAGDAPVGAHLQMALVSLALGDRNAAVAEQTSVQSMLTACDAACGDARRGLLQAGYDQITQALNPPTPTLLVQLPPTLKLVLATKIPTAMVMLPVPIASALLILSVPAFRVVPPL